MFKFLKLTKEDRDDLLGAAKHIGVGLSIFLLIAAIGSAVRTPGWAIPVAAVVSFVASWFGDKKEFSPKDHLTRTIVYTAATTAFTALAVLAS